MAHHMLPGSWEVIADGVAQVGVHTGTSEWDIQNLRYVRMNLAEEQARIVSEGRDPAKVTLIETLGEIYDREEGTVI